MRSEKLVTKEQRQDIAENHFRVFGDVRKVRVADIDYIATEIQKERRANNQSMIISLEPVKENRFKDPRYNLKFAKDVENDIFYGVVIGMYPDDNIHWRSIPINEYITLNLNNIDDAKIWAVLRMHPDTEDSPLQKTDPVFRVHDPEVIAIKKISDGKDKIKAMNRSGLLEGEPLVSFARSLGILVSATTSLNELRGELMDYAEKYHKEFNDKWDDPERNFSEIFANAVAIGVIKHDQTKGYFFGSIPLGTSVPYAIAFLKNETNLLATVTTEISNKDRDKKRLAADEEKEIKQAQDVKRVEKKAANKKLEEELNPEIVVVK
jgi:hypothetical protein